ncbi:MAG: hypothetical protein ACLTXD_01080 [Clostridia bacterium]
MSDKSNKIKIVSGDGKDLDISKVYEHLNVDEPNSEVNDSNKIIIPPSKKQ